MKRLEKHFQDMLVSAEYRYWERLLDRIYHYQFTQTFLVHASSGSFGNCPVTQRILRSLVNDSKPQHLSKQTLADPLKCSFS